MSRRARPAETRARKRARWGLILVFGAAGLAHLLLTDAFLRIMPEWVPHPRAVVIATGLAELTGVAGLATRRWRRAAGIGLALYTACVFPANIKHAIDDLTAGTGLPIWYHGPRLMLQPAIAWWCLWSAGVIRRPVRGRGAHRDR